MRLAFVTNKPYSTCETFVKAQIDHLPFEIEHFWGFNLPLNIKPSDKLADRLKRRIWEKDKAKILSSEFRKRKIDVVLAHYGMMGVKVLPVCVDLSLPLVVHFHGHDAVRKSVLEEYEHFYKEMFSYSRCTVISVSHEMTKRLIKIGCPQEKIIYNVYGPNNSFFKVNPTYGNSQFIGIGRFVEKKAPHFTILAFDKILKIHPDAKLVIAGDGGLHNSVKDLVQALDIEKNVNLPGKITPEEYKLYLQDSLAFVQHSIEAQDGDMEGTPVALLEAGAAGLPTISTFHAGIPDVVIHKETGLLSYEKDIEGMADNMLWILENKKESVQMGKNAKKRIETDFSFDKHIRQLAAILEASANKIS
ncbi:hypothetical protein GCM10007103_32710 [Salinimicrobium marinum]|uniref:Uncharacterized protein n=1 Tax=Salinimicrobium marinum TaxID=680283 RepID=A0A918W037_9FLAO|nr:glycosyltransferase [Salinimicrobium marinum]GHA49350.1 hypothetical protein GCM10007103_32710 [Salinimicrobium marinum]